jgi:hypothetical protein
MPRIYNGPRRPYTIADQETLKQRLEGKLIRFHHVYGHDTVGICVGVLTYWDHNGMERRDDHSINLVIRIKRLTDAGDSFTSAWMVDCAFEIYGEEQP